MTGANKRHCSTKHDDQKISLFLTNDSRHGIAQENHGLEVQIRLLKFFSPWQGTCASGPFTFNPAVWSLVASELVEDEGEAVSVSRPKSQRLTHNGEDPKGGAACFLFGQWSFDSSALSFSAFSFSMYHTPMKRTPCWNTSSVSLSNNLSWCCCHLFYLFTSVFLLLFVSFLRQFGVVADAVLVFLTYNQGAITVRIRFSSLRILLLGKFYNFAIFSYE